MSEDSPTQRPTKSKALLIALISVGGALLLAVIVLLVALLAGSGGGAAETLPTPSSSDTATSPSPAPSEAEGPSPAPSETEEEQETPPPPPPSNDPKIDKFTLSPTKISCHVVTADAPFENPVYELKFSWSSSNAEEVYFGIDSPGGDASNGPFDQDLPADGTESDLHYKPITFTCPTSAGVETKHYTLTITGHGKKASKTLELKVETK